LHQAKQSRFPIGIQDRTYNLASEKLKQLGYEGPVALSCDDTKLLASLRPYYDHDCEGYYLMGHIGEPLLLPDPDAFRDVVESHEIRKATKVRSVLHDLKRKSITHYFTSFAFGVYKFQYLKFPQLWLPPLAFPII
jgi:hypothetical protein